MPTNVNLYHEMIRAYQTGSNELAYCLAARLSENGEGLSSSQLKNCYHVWKSLSFVKE